MKETCLTCHKDKTEKQMNLAIDAMKGHFEGKVREAEARMNDMFDAFDLAIAAGVDQKTLDEARKLHASAHVNWDTGRLRTAPTSTILNSPRAVSRRAPRPRAMPPLS